MEVIFEIIFEIVFQVVLELFGAWFGHIFQNHKSKTNSTTTASHKQSGIKIPIIYFIAGLTLGLISLYVMPDHYIKSEVYKVVALIFSPLFAGLIMHSIAKARTKYGKQIVSFENFYNGFFFALGISLIRFLFAN
jgi:hypothetical protein